MTDYTIADVYALPSGGKIYEQDVTPNVKLRSMTTVEEMKRLNHSDRPYRAMSEIIDDCMVEKIGISAYDLCLPDYQYLLHKLRVVTYGTDYKLSSTCPYCGMVNTPTINLDALTVIPFDEDEYKKYSEFVLPACGKKIKLRMQTPRILDDIAVKSKEQRRKSPQMNGDPAFLFTLEALVDTIDGEKVPKFQIIPFIQKLSMRDTNYLLKSAQRLNSLFGIDSELVNTCRVCGLDYNSSFRTTSEFFGPSID
jgi:hypothetical protein